MESSAGEPRRVVMPLQTKLVGALLVLLLAGSAEGGGWLRLRSENFELFTDAGAGMGRRSILQLEQIRQVFAGIGAGARTSPIPVVVYMFGSNAEYRQYRPSAASRGFYSGGPNADYIVIQAWNPGVRRVVFHEYVHVVLNHTSVRLPQWLEEGTAEFYSTVEPVGDQIRVGLRVPEHIRTLAGERWMSAAKFREIDHNSPVFTEDRRIGVYYAQSWALVHMLFMGDGYRDKMPRFAELLEEPADGDPFEEAFGSTMAEALEDARHYVRRELPTIKVDWEPPEEFEIVVEPMDEVETERAKMSLQLDMGLWSVSEKSLQKLAKKKGESPEIETARALIAISREDEAAAEKHFDRAIELGSTEAGTYFEYAMLLKESGAAPERVRELLERTVEIDPRHPEALFLLGSAAASEGRHRDAIGPLEQAVAVLPRRSYFWHALALSYFHAGRKEDAELAARRALDAARSVPESEMALSAIDLVTRKEERVDMGPRPAVSTPESWRNPAGDSVAEGVLERIDCLGESARLHLKSGGELLALLVKDPSKVVLKNVTAISFEFACGEAQPRSVKVEYVARPDAETETDGEITAIEFR